MLAHRAGRSGVTHRYDEPALVEVAQLRKYFPVRRRLHADAQWVKAVDDVSFRIGAGETFSLAGETGCGKTTITRMILMVTEPSAGDVYFLGKNTRDFGPADVRTYRSSVQAVFQDPWSSLNPRMRVRDIVAEPLHATRQFTKREAHTRALELLDVVGLSAAAGKRFPHQFSGGQRQRIAIARALAPNPRLIVLDEPVSSLDVSIRAQIMNLLKDLQRQSGVSYLLIAHDLATVRFLSHRVGVLYLGKIVEEGDAKAIFGTPSHPYTRALVSATLPAHPDQEHLPLVLQGEVPSPVNPPAGCPFHPRCPYVMDICSTVPPPLAHTGDRVVACHLYPASPTGETAPGVVSSKTSST
jgi:oligopeptide/dipeptide ABC transporter ATP-binding protein